MKENCKLAKTIRGVVLASSVLTLVLAAPASFAQNNNNNNNTTSTTNTTRTETRDERRDEDRDWGWLGLLGLAGLLGLMPRKRHAVVHETHDARDRAPNTNRR